MIPKSIASFIILLFFSLNGTAVQISKTDSVLLQKFWQYACEHNLASLPMKDRIITIGRFFLNTPYQANTLNRTNEEKLVVNLHELDCVTFVENVLALSYLPVFNEESFDLFIHNLQRIRYRNGEITDYASRLHYSSDWLYEMGKQKLLTDETPNIGGLGFKPSVHFMSDHSHLYPPLQDKTLLEKMKRTETEINKRTYYYIPKHKIGEAYEKIESGDIILITTKTKGLDTSHLGIAYKKDGKIWLLHASSQGKKVMFSRQPLYEYMQGIPSHQGIMIGRAVPQPAPETQK